MPDDFSWRTPSPAYAWSQDYAALLDAMVEGAVMAICLYDTLHDGTKIFDACFIMRRPISYKHVEFVTSARGIEYFSARDADEFVELCEKYEVRFLDPNADKAACAALAPIRRHAMSHDLGAPLRFSVAESREIVRKVDEHE